MDCSSCAILIEDLPYFCFHFKKKLSYTCNSFNCYLFLYKIMDIYFCALSWVPFSPDSIENLVWALLKHLLKAVETAVQLAGFLQFVLGEGVNTLSDICKLLLPMTLKGPIRCYTNKCLGTSVLRHHLLPQMSVLQWSVLHVGDFLLA